MRFDTLSSTTRAFRKFPFDAGFAEKNFKALLTQRLHFFSWCNEIPFVFAEFSHVLLLENPILSIVCCLMFIMALAPDATPYSLVLIGFNAIIECTKQGSAIIQRQLKK